MPKPRSIIQAPIELPCTDVVALEAGDPYFADHRPDSSKAYVRMRFAHSLPVVAGPESVSGTVFGMHPAVVARHFHSAIHQQTNLGHRLKASGAPRDRIVGCIVQLAYPEEPEGGWVVPESIADAPAIHAVAVMWKQAEGVEALLGQMMANKAPWSISLEASFMHEETGIYDPRTREVYDPHEIPNSLRGQVMQDQHGRLSIRRGSNLVKVLGGKSGTLWFTGLGYTTNPAEPTAVIDGVAAAKPDGQGMVRASLETEPDFLPGMAVRWRGGEYCRGTIRAAYYTGSISRHGKTLEGDPLDPALDIMLPNGVAICRRSSSVIKA